MTLFVAALGVFCVSFCFGVAQWIAEHGPRETFDRIGEKVWR